MCASAHIRECENSYRSLCCANMSRIAPKILLLRRFHFFHSWKIFDANLDIKKSRCNSYNCIGMDSRKDGKNLGKFLGKTISTLHFWQQKQGVCLR